MERSSGRARTWLRSAGGPVSGSVSTRMDASSGRDGRIGSVRRDASGHTVRVTTSGDGQTIGQYVVETETRTRWPARNAYGGVVQLDADPLAPARGHGSEILV